LLNSPECVIYCNSQYLTVKQWLDSVADITDLENDPRNELKIDVSYTRAKLFQSLQRNLQKMFPKTLLDVELVAEDGSLEIYLKISKTTLELRKKKELLKVREERYLELQRYVHSKKLTGTLDGAREVLLEMVSKDDHESWSKKHEAFSKVLQEELDLVFSDPGRISRAFAEEDPLAEDETALLDYLASKVIESQPTSGEDSLGFTRIVDFVAKLQKPVISHNGIMDLMFLYDKFYQPLPETTGEFKATLHSLFPHIYDTKHMINTRQELQQLFPNSMLSEAYLRVQKDDFLFNDQKVSIHKGFPDYSLKGDIYHEAGFDALMTGVVWYKMMTYLGRERKFPGVQAIMENTLFNTLDKNKVPMASLRSSLNLQQQIDSTTGLLTDSKTFVFLL